VIVHGPCKLNSLAAERQTNVNKHNLTQVISATVEFFKRENPIAVIDDSDKTENSKLLTVKNGMFNDHSNTDG